MAGTDGPNLRETILAMFGWPPDALAFDPLDYETWPQTLMNMAGKVREGLENGDLEPLAAYLRAGFPLPAWLSLQLADAIDPKGGGRYCIKSGGRKTGEMGERVAAKRYARNSNIGLYVCYLIHKNGPGSYDAAIVEARQKFKLGSKSTHANKHYIKVRDHAFEHDGSIHPFYSVFFSEIYWENYPFNRSD